MSDNQKNRPASNLSLTEAMHLQALEGNPMDAEQAAMFAMFEREGFSAKQRRAYIQKRVLQRVGVPAAE
jgi:hypothetical protein